MKKLLLVLLIIIYPIIANANAVEINGVYYNLISKLKTAEVTKVPNGKQMYKGELIIPASVTYEGEEYNVEAIGNYAFELCYNLKSITISQSIKSIGVLAFFNCTGLTSIVIPNGVSSIKDEAFYGCSGLSSIKIPSSVTYLGDRVFVNCSGLKAIDVENDNKYYDSRDNCNAIIEKSTNKLILGCENSIIPNSVSSIERLAFAYCTNLKAVSIPHSVINICDDAFYCCSGLQLLEIKNGLSHIGNRAFRECSSLTSVKIPSSINSIGDYAFYDCSKLKTISIGKGIEKIGSGAFASCKDITDVYCYSEQVPQNVRMDIEAAGYGKTVNDAFIDALIEYATLHVPASSVNAYKVVEPWKNFKNIVAIDGDTPQERKCVTPTISYINGRLKFNCETEGVVFLSEITSTDIKRNYESEVELTATYNISVYAAKTDYENSDVATATLCWIEATPQAEGVSNGVAQVSARAVMIQSLGGTLDIQGVEDGISINVYDTNGTQVGSAISRNGQATVNTILQAGNLAFVKIGQKSVKVVMK